MPLFPLGSGLFTRLFSAGSDPGQVLKGQHPLYPCCPFGFNICWKCLPLDAGSEQMVHRDVTTGSVLRRESGQERVQRSVAEPCVYTSHPPPNMSVSVCTRALSLPTSSRPASRVTFLALGDFPVSLVTDRKRIVFVTYMSDTLPTLWGSGLYPSL